MKTYRLIPLCALLLLAGCSKQEQTIESGRLSFFTSVRNFEGEIETRTNFEGNAFEDGDRIKLKVICPFSSHTEFGETTYGNSFDAFWLLKWHTGGWATLQASDGFDIDGDYSPSASPDIYGRYEAQQTPYVYTAQTWSEEQMFIAGNNTRVEQYSYVFHADQTREADYKASDLLWAQTIQQTGSYNVHLSFRHMMAALLITVDDNTGLSGDAILTLEGMPDIDQSEVIVGDYYAAASKVNSNNYGYKSKHSCTREQNGTILGIAVVNDSQHRTLVIPFSQIGQGATYTAFNAGAGTYRLIIPPCTLSSNPTFWIRDGEKRYSMEMDRNSFESGKLYRITMQIN